MTGNYITRHWIHAHTDGFLAVFETWLSTPRTMHASLWCECWPKYLSNGVYLEADFKCETFDLHAHPLIYIWTLLLLNVTFFQFSRCRKRPFGPSYTLFLSKTIDPIFPIYFSAAFSPTHTCQFHPDFPTIQFWRASYLLEPLYVGRSGYRIFKLTK